MLGTWDVPNKNWWIALLIFMFIFLYVCMEFLSKWVTSVVQQSTRKSIHMTSPKLELGINPVSEETWKELPPSVMLEGCRFYTPWNRKKKKWARQHLLDLISSIEISPSPRPYYGQIQEPDVCIKKKNLPGVSMAVYPIFTLPSRLRLRPTEPEQQIGMYKLQPAEEVKERWGGPTPGY